MANVDLPDEVATDRESLSGPESDLLDVTFDKGLEDTRSEDTNTVVEKLREYREEFMVGAEIARAQFDQKFGGLNPGSGRYALSRIRAGYFGFDSWEGTTNLTGMTAGGPVNWINDGHGTHLDGTDTSFGNPLRVGEDAVHVVCGIGEYSPSPKISAYKYEINEEPRTSIQSKWETTKTDIGIKWLDRAIILPEDSLFEMRAFPDVGGDAAPYLVGGSYIESRASQVFDPEEMSLDTSGNNADIVDQG